MDEEIEVQREPLTYGDVAALAMAIALYLGRDDKTIIDHIGHIADSIKAEMEKDKNDAEPETA